MRTCCCSLPDLYGPEVCKKCGAGFSDSPTITELKQDQKDFPHIAQDIQVAIDHEKRELENDMSVEQTSHMQDNYMAFVDKYVPKYIGGQKAHKGNMWEMGAYQVLENMEEEILDQWSYARQIRKCLEEITVSLDEHVWNNAEELRQAIKGILNRQKDDGEK